MFNDGNESLDDLKYLLGNMGMEILIAIDRGAKNFNTIKLFSGVPLSCIKGRVPVLLDLTLIKEINKEYLITDKGTDFINKIQRSAQ